jgi:hypothetical protein
MNPIKHLSNFYDKVSENPTLNATHISLYMALFQVWVANQFKNPLSVTRSELMPMSKISSKATYHKCLKELHAQGYIQYKPSFHPYKGSQVSLTQLKDP